MPSILDDPTAPTNHRQSGSGTFHLRNSPLPADLQPREVKLRDGSPATIIPFSTPTQAPPGLVKCLSDLMNREIEAGDTYPTMDPISFEKFGPYWFANVTIVALRGDLSSVKELLGPVQEDDIDWDQKCLGTFYIKPNYPGRSSHVCNAGFLVHEGARGIGVGKILGQIYIEWAPKLGYIYSVFNLVYVTNTASLRLWDSLGFQRIGRVPGAGQLKGHVELVDAIQYGRHLVPKGMAGEVAVDHESEAEQSQRAGTRNTDEAAIPNNKPTVSGV